MANELRKVSYALGYPQGFVPDENVQKEQDELSEWKDGFFHIWTYQEELSPQSGNFREKVVALVEDIDTGEVHLVNYDLIKFKTQPS